MRYEKPERNGDGMECIDQNHTDTINTNVSFPAQLMGGGEFLWIFVLSIWGELVAGRKNIPWESERKEQWEYSWNGTCGMERVFLLLRGAEEDA